MNDRGGSEFRQFLDEWNRALIEKDLQALERLRDVRYRAAIPGERVLSREEEIALIQSGDSRIDNIAVHRFDVTERGEEAIVACEYHLDGEFSGESANGLYRQRITVRRRGDGWRAIHSRTDEVVFSEAAAVPRPPASLARRAAKLLPQRARRWLKRQLPRSWLGARASFQDVAYVPYRPGQDYVLPPPPPAAAPDQAAPLPVPPQELWLGYNYPAHGEAHVARMMEIVEASGFAPGDGDRILDLGCGAGRMIRHLRHLADRCEIWGTDISAEHIFWCRQHLSPPFHFATTTKVPHLPFEDRSFALIYCGSLFTHIDDLADAWLLELHRILAPDGRLYITVHDNRTIELFEDSPHSNAAIVREIKASPTFRAGKGEFGMFTVGRDNESQVFYDEDFLRKMLSQAFEIVSVTREAYFYQTAYLLKRKGPAGQ